MAVCNYKYQCGHAGWSRRFGSVHCILLHLINLMNQLLANIQCHYYVLSKKMPCHHYFLNITVLGEYAGSLCSFVNYGTGENSPSYCLTELVILEWHSRQEGKLVTKAAGN